MRFKCECSPRPCKVVAIAAVAVGMATDWLWRVSRLLEGCTENVCGWKTHSCHSGMRSARRWAPIIFMEGVSGISLHLCCVDDTRLKKGSRRDQFWSPLQSDLGQVLLFTDGEVFYY